MARKPVNIFADLPGQLRRAVAADCEARARKLAAEQETPAPAPTLPRGLKPSKAVTLAGLRRAKPKVTAAKSIGEGTIKVYTSGPTNYYVGDSQSLRRYLRKAHGVSF